MAKKNVFKEKVDVVLKKVSSFFSGDVGKKVKKEKIVSPLLPSHKKQQEVVVDMTSVSLAKATVVVLLMILLLFFLNDIRGVLVIFFVSFLFAAALDPFVDRLNQMKIPRALAVILIYIVLVVLLGVFITNVVSLVAVQIAGITSNIGEFVSRVGQDHGGDLPFLGDVSTYLDKLYSAVDLQTAAAQVQSALSIISGQLVSVSIGLANLIIVLVLTFFMTVEETAIEKFYLSLFPSRYAHYISSKMDAVKVQIGLWLRGQLLVSFIAFLLSYIGLVVMGVDYALTLSLIAGVMMIVALGFYLLFYIATV